MNFELLKIDEMEKFQAYFELFVANSFSHKSFIPLECLKYNRIALREIHGIDFR